MKGMATRLRPFSGALAILCPNSRSSTTWSSSRAANANRAENFGCVTTAYTRLEKSKVKWMAWRSPVTEYRLPGCAVPLLATCSLKIVQGQVQNNHKIDVLQKEPHAFFVNFSSGQRSKYCFICKTLYTRKYQYCRFSNKIHASYHRKYYIYTTESIRIIWMQRVECHNSVKMQYFSILANGTNASWIKNQITITYMYC